MSSSAQAAPMKAVIPNFPIRTQWEHGHGYCGELSIQQTALTCGVWVGQQQARNIGGGEVLLGRPGSNLNNLQKVLQALGFDFVVWDPDSEAGQGIPTSYMRWMKQQIIAGRAAIFGARLQDGEDDAWYDHIMPAYGIYYDSSTAGQYDARDTLTWTDNYGTVANKTMSDESFYAEQYNCEMPQDTYSGCIPLGADTFATAMGGLLDARKLFLPLRLIITGWSNGAEADSEPRVNTNPPASARYRLAFQPGANVRPGNKFAVHRCDRAANGSGGPPANPTDASQLAAAGCRSWDFTMNSSTLPQLSHRALGVLWSNSIVYFVATRQQ
uniref:Peptidase C39-like domain-containing protein n=1 Tax=Tetradesmus obliquus TaxID=3088 RepID=A0A383WD23_TETOB|eukprot:jgi/Sobl393_1/856/SZX75518.1